MLNSKTHRKKNANQCVLTNDVKDTFLGGDGPLVEKNE